MSDFAEEEVYEVQFPGREEVEDEAPLSQDEEEKLKEVSEDKVIKKLTELKNRVMVIKSVIENDDFIEIYIKPIRGNITEIKEKLESVEKTRDLAVMQGKLSAYRKMLKFPETSVDNLQLEVDEVRRQMPLFYGANEFVKKCSIVSFDKDRYRITIG